MVNITATRYEKKTGCLKHRVTGELASYRHLKFKCRQPEMLIGQNDSFWQTLEKKMKTCGKSHISKIIEGRFILKEIPLKASRDTVKLHVQKDVRINSWKYEYPHFKSLFFNKKGGKSSYTAILKFSWHNWKDLDVKSLCDVRKTYTLSSANEPGQHTAATGAGLDGGRDAQTRSFSKETAPPLPPPLVLFETWEIRSYYSPTFSFFFLRCMVMWRPDAGVLLLGTRTHSGHVSLRALMCSGWFYFNDVQFCSNDLLVENGTFSNNRVVDKIPPITAQHALTDHTHRHHPTPPPHTASHPTPTHDTQPNKDTDTTAHSAKQTSISVIHPIRGEAPHIKISNGKKRWKSLSRKNEIPREKLDLDRSLASYFWTENSRLPSEGFKHSFQNCAKEYWKPSFDIFFTAPTYYVTYFLRWLGLQLTHKKIATSCSKWPQGGSR